MRNQVKSSKSMAVVAVAAALLALLLPSLSLANNEPGSLTDARGTHNSSDSHAGTHGAGTHNLTAKVTLGAAANINSYVDWLAVPMSGNCAYRKLTAKRKEIGKLVKVDGTVRYWDATTVDPLVDPASGSWSNKVHKPKQSRGTTAVTDTPATADFEVGESETTLYLTFTSTLSVSGGNRNYTYTVDNHTGDSFSFVWDMARNTTHTTGWSGTVAANDSVTITHVVSEATGTYIVYSAASATSASLDYDKFPSSTLVSAEFLTFPAAVTGLSAGQVGADVTLTWTNGATYDSIQVVRDDDEAVGWFVGGTATSFTDENVPAGAHTYEVVGLNSCVGSNATQANITVN